MTVKSLGAKIFAKIIYHKTQKWATNPIETQKKILEQLILAAKNTQFGKDHFFDKIKNHEDFAQNIPVRDYEGLKPYIEEVVKGKEDILWKGKPVYFAKTSGTTSGAKYIPITRESMPYHIEAARNAILSYIYETGNASFVNRKMIFLQGSPILEEKNGIKLGRLSGIVAHFVPKYLMKNRLPSWETNCIEDWETKVNAVVEETINENMSVISGIPSWVQMYFEKLQQKSGKKIGDLFPNFNLFIYGGVNFEPYRSNFERLIGRKIDSIELFPASEGFFAYQDTRNEKGMLLLLNSGIFYEFIKADEFFTNNPRRYIIGEVELNTNYVLILSTNAGLWGYNIGDTVIFTSLKPHRIIVSGRIKHFISAFGEHVIAKEVEYAMQIALQQTNAQIVEFTVAPQIQVNQELPYHHWYIEFEKKPNDLEIFTNILDQEMRKQNIYYEDLRKGNVLQMLKIELVTKNGFQNYMKSIGRLGGQNKIQRLANDRKIVDLLKTIN